MPLVLAILALLILVGTANSQQKIGNWKVDHFKPFGEWESFCDHRTENSVVIRRCYLRRVEVYSDRPKFGALYFFLTEEKGENSHPISELEFGFEPGTRFHGDGFVIESGNNIVYRLNTGGCENGHRCWIKGIPAQSLQRHLVKGNQLRFRFTDKRGDKWDIAWTADGYQNALANFKSASQQRGLPE